jgi:hypothetical protein
MNLKAECLQLMSNPIRWEVWSEKIIGFVNSSAVFEITLDDSFQYRVKTYYPNRTIDDDELWAENNSLEFIKMVCDERYRIWLKEDFIKNNRMK